MYRAILGVMPTSAAISVALPTPRQYWRMTSIDSAFSNFPGSASHEGPALVENVSSSSVTTSLTEPTQSRLYLLSLHFSQIQVVSLVPSQMAQRVIYRSSAETR